MAAPLYWRFERERTPARKHMLGARGRRNPEAGRGMAVRGALAGRDAGALSAWCSRKKICGRSLLGGRLGAVIAFGALPHLACGAMFGGISDSCFRQGVENSPSGLRDACSVLWCG